MSPFDLTIVLEVAAGVFIGLTAFLAAFYGAGAYLEYRKKRAFEKMEKKLIETQDKMKLANEGMLRVLGNLNEGLNRETNGLSDFVDKQQKPKKTKRKPWAKEYRFCSICLNNDRPHHAKGLCRSCYWYKKGR